MPRFTFALSTDHLVREVGYVNSDSFDDALASIREQLAASEGDTLEIGVTGFPPAQYDCVLSLDDGLPDWRPHNRMAA